MTARFACARCMAGARPSRAMASSCYTARHCPCGLTFAGCGQRGTCRQYRSASVAPGCHRRAGGMELRTAARASIRARRIQGDRRAAMPAVLWHWRLSRRRWGHKQRFRHS
eukprot:1348106-Prymnesium_polylepis.1